MYVFNIASMDSLDLVSPYLFKHRKRNFLVQDELRPADLDALQHFETRPTDIFLITYPKSGQLLAIICHKDQHLYSFFITQLIISIDSIRHEGMK